MNKDNNLHKINILSNNNNLPQNNYDSFNHNYNIKTNIKNNNPNINQIIMNNNNLQNSQMLNIINSNYQNQNNINTQLQTKINEQLANILLNQNKINLQSNPNFKNNINHFPKKNNINISQNNNNNNSNNIHLNHNDNNKKGNNNQINEKNLSFSQLDNLLNLNQNNNSREGCPIINIINKKGVSFFITLSKTMKGSKYLQHLLYISPPKQQEVDLITKIICLNYQEIMCDYYGNYFLQLFFLHCNSKNRLDILNSLKKDYIKIANDICGNHSLQCLISLQMTNEEKEIIKYCVINNLKELCLGMNSSHVISKIIKSLKEGERQYINAFVVNNLKILCYDPNGICIVKEFIYNIKSNSKLFEKLCLADHISYVLGKMNSKK